MFQQISNRIYEELISAKSDKILRLKMSVLKTQSSIYKEAVLLTQNQLKKLMTK
jgi:hypothetical protein